MDLVPDTEDGSSFDRHIDDIARQLADLREELRDLQEALRSYPKPNTKQAGQTLAELRYWLKQAMETEAQIAERNKQKNGGSTGFFIDLEDVKDQIGRRLDRLKGRSGD